jgi:hypothetical protein
MTSRSQLEQIYALGAVEWGREKSMLVTKDLGGYFPSDLAFSEGQSLGM